MSTVRGKRATPRRRLAPQWGTEEWEYANTLLMVRSQGRCEIGGCDLNRTGIERHHRIRRRDGGDRLSNLMVLCPHHHRHVTEHPGEAYANGWSIRALTDQDPASVPVRIHPGRLWLLDDEGFRRLIP